MSLLSKAGFTSISQYFTQCVLLVLNIGCISCLFHLDITCVAQICSKKHLAQIWNKICVDMKPAGGVCGSNEVRKPLTTTPAFPPGQTLIKLCALKNIRKASLLHSDFRFRRWFVASVDRRLWELCALRATFHLYCWLCKKRKRHVGWCLASDGFWWPQMFWADVIVIFDMLIWK